MNTSDGIDHCKATIRIILDFFRYYRRIIGRVDAIKYNEPVVLDTLGRVGVVIYDEQIVLAVL